MALGFGGASLQDSHSCQAHPHTWQHPHCPTRLSPQDRSPLTVPRVRVTNHPPWASTMGHLPVSPGLVDPWPGPGAMA